jgi:uncharacterized protein with PQ loop repeat
MQNALKSTASVSFIFFVIYGTFHMSASFLVAQGVIDKTIFLLFNALDLPFLLAGLIYGTSNLSLTAAKIFGSVKVPLIVCTVISAVIFLIALYVNFLLPDANLFL